MCDTAECRCWNFPHEAGVYRESCYRCCHLSSPPMTMLPLNIIIIIIVADDSNRKADDITKIKRQSDYCKYLQTCLVSWCHQKIFEASTLTRGWLILSVLLCLPWGPVLTCIFILFSAKNSTKVWTLMCWNLSQKWQQWLGRLQENHDHISIPYGDQRINMDQGKTAVTSIALHSFTQN